MKKVKKLSKILFSAYLLSAFIFSSGAVMPVGIAEASPQSSVTICHATSAHNNPYTENTVNKNSIISGGHDIHEGPVWYFGITESWGDIIPSFTYGQASSTQHYPGKNWTSEGQAIWNNSCKVEFPPQETSVTLCKEDKDGKKLGGWELSLVSDDHTFSGITEEKCKNTGCVTLENVPYDTYEIKETLQKGWKNVSGLDKVQIKSENPKFTVVNEKIKEPKTGSITVCKIIIDPDGNIVDGSEKSGDVFVIPGLSSGEIPGTSPAPIGVIPDSQFTAPLGFNADLIGNDGINDAQCITYDGLELGGYYYGEEILPKKGWETPLYNDQHKTQVNSLGDFFGFSGELLDGDPANDDERNTDADGHIVLSESRPNRTLVVLNQYKEMPEDKATIKAYKVVCEDESYLPNWVKTSSFPAQITEDLINQYVADSEGKCWFESGWEFEWGYQGTAQKQDGYFYGPAGESKGWNSFDSATGDNTPAILEIEEDDLASIIWIREVLQQGYIPFAHPEQGWDTGQEMVSAELLCHIDGYKYDNYDRVDNPQANSTYYCVAFNALIEGKVYYTVTFDGNGGTPTSTDIVVESGQTVDPLPIVTRSGYNFVEWNTEDDGTGDEFTTLTEVNADITVYAQWQELVQPTYNLLTATSTGFGWITSDPAGIHCGYEASDCEEEYLEGTEVTLTAEPGSGQKFDGWAGDCTGTDTVCVLTMDGAKDVSAAFSLIPGITTYTVTFDGNGGTPASTDVEVPEGETVDPLPTVTREGFSFVEWNTEDDGTGDKFTASTEVIADITVYAIWQETEEPIYGCTDPRATNYSPNATKDDGSCTYRRRSSTSYASPPPGEVLGEEIIVEPCGIYLFEYIKYGANNNPTEVIKLQTFLNQHMGTGLTVNGVYDWATMQALNHFQLQYKNEVLKPWVDAGAYCDANRPTGYVYKTTQRWINLIMCPTLNIPMPDLSAYPKADCAGYWEQVLGEDIVVDEDYVPEDIVDEFEEPEAEDEEEVMPIDIEEIVTKEPGEERDPLSLWLIAIIVLVAAVAIWSVYRGSKK